MKPNSCLSDRSNRMLVNSSKDYLMVLTGFDWIAIEYCQQYRKSYNKPTESKHLNSYIFFSAANYQPWYSIFVHSFYTFFFLLTASGYFAWIGSWKTIEIYHWFTHWKMKNWKIVSNSMEMVSLSDSLRATQQTLLVNIFRSKSLFVG